MSQGELKVLKVYKMQMVCSTDSVKIAFVVEWLTRSGERGVITEKSRTRNGVTCPQGADVQLEGAVHGQGFYQIKDCQLKLEGLEHCRFGPLAGCGTSSGL